MSTIFSFVRPIFQANVVSTSWKGLGRVQPAGLFVRTVMKSHKGAAKRWRKTANGFKRSQAARNHGNTGWGRAVLGSDSSKQMSNKAQTKRLSKLLPYA